MSELRDDDAELLPNSAVHPVQLTNPAPEKLSRPEGLGGEPHAPTVAAEAKPIAAIRGRVNLAHAQVRDVDKALRRLKTYRMVRRVLITLILATLFIVGWRLFLG